MWSKPTPDDFSTEIRAHLDLETDRLIAEGMAPEEARLAARKAFGSVAAAEERYFESTRAVWLDQLRQDVRVAARSITKYPVAAIVAVASLAFGIGAMTTTLIVRDVIFRKPPRLYQRPSELSLLLVARPDRPGALYPYESTVPGTVYTAWRATGTWRSFFWYASSMVANLTSAGSGCAPDWRAWSTASPNCRHSPPGCTHTPRRIAIA